MLGKLSSKKVQTIEKLSVRVRKLKSGMRNLENHIKDRLKEIPKAEVGCNELVSVRV